MKFIHVYALFLISVFHNSCGQSQTNSPKDNIRSETKDTITSPGSNDPDIHTKYGYTDSIGKEVPSLPGKYFKILVPPDTMTLDKEPLFNHGLTDLESFLDKSIHKSSSLKRTINPKESSGFFVVMLCLIEGAHGTMRTGLSLKGQNLFYRIKVDGSKSNSKSSDKEIHCGSITTSHA
jgi:hypothetical protein